MSSAHRAHNIQIEIFWKHLHICIYKIIYLYVIYKIRCQIFSLIYYYTLLLLPKQYRYGGTYITDHTSGHLCNKHHCWHYNEPVSCDCLCSSHRNKWRTETTSSASIIKQYNRRYIVIIYLLLLDYKLISYSYIPN